MKNATVAGFALALLALIASGTPTMAGKLGGAAQGAAQGATRGGPPPGVFINPTPGIVSSTIGPEVGGGGYIDRTGTNYRGSTPPSQPHGRK